MSRSRRRARRSGLLLVGTLCASAASAMIAACSFPDVTFTPAGTGAEGGAEAGMPESSTSDGATDAPSVIFDSGDPDVLITKDAGGRVDASGCTTCDCDGDGFNRASCDAGSDAGPIDCDDTDTRAKPGQKYLAIPAEPPLNGNWNCVNGRENFYVPNIDCTKLAGGAACDGTFGFSDDPACGTTGTFVSCKTVGALPPLLSSCAVANMTLDQTTQACR